MTTHPDGRAAGHGTTTTTTTARAVHVAIIGAGMSGICMAIKLRQAGIGSFTIYEKADDVGGTWRDNRYPGLTCDIPAPFYTYTFAPNPDWTSRYAAGAEIHHYFKSVADKHGILREVCYNTEIVDARFDGDTWQLRSADGQTFTADVVVAATGVLHHPRIPDIPGLDDFAGQTFHSARWDESVALDGRRIGVIGTGSTGVQIVTALSERASSVTQFQRSAQWIFPLPNWTYSRVCRALLRRSPRLNRALYDVHAWLLSHPVKGVIKPGWQRTMMQAICRANLLTIRNRALRDRMTPDYQPMCRRLVFSAGYYRAIERPGVEVIDTRIDHIDPKGVVTSDGRLHELDVLALATGFDTHAYLRPMQVTGRTGITLTDAWSNGPRAHRTVAIPGFPNFFLLMGPNSPIGNTSLVPIAESQAAFVLGWVRRMISGEISHVVPTTEAAAQYNTTIRDNMGDTVWVTGCDSWYIGPDGHPTMWPFSVEEFHRMLAEPDDSEYSLQFSPMTRTSA